MVLFMMVCNGADEQRVTEACMAWKLVSAIKLNVLISIDIVKSICAVFRQPIHLLVDGAW